MTTKTPNPTIELTLHSGATITSDAFPNAGDMVARLKIPLTTLARHCHVDLPTMSVVETVTAWQEKLDIILDEVKKLKHERYQLAMAIANLTINAGIASKVDMTGPQLLMLAEDASGLIKSLKDRIEQLRNGIMHHKRELTIGDDLSDIDIALYKLVAEQEPQK